MSNAFIIKTEQLSKVYRMGSSIVNALDAVDLTVCTSELLALVGASGSGKSTLLNLIGGLDSPSSGKVIVCGKNLSQQSPKELAMHRRHNVGMVFQSFNLIPSMTAAENVQLALTFAGIRRSERKQRAMQVLSSVGLEDRQSHRPSELSGGEQQRTALARALANQPKILLADEPTGNLDGKTSIEIMELFKRINAKGMTILLVTHNVSLAERYCDRLLHISYGKIGVEEESV